MVHWKIIHELYQFTMPSLSIEIWHHNDLLYYSLAVQKVYFQIRMNDNITLMDKTNITVSTKQIY